MRRLIQITLTTIVVTAGSAGTAAAQSYVSPDAASQARQTSTSVDLRSPDARNPSPAVDLRSPDAVDAAQHPVATFRPGRATALQPQQSVVQVPANGFSWGDAGIGAAGMLALIALAAGTLMIATHRRRGPVVSS
jgi:hypothetical protein